MRPPASDVPCRTPVCGRCGTCCTAPDISTIGKPLGVRCRHLDEENFCTIYDERPQVCRNYFPDELCRRIAAPSLPERVRNYLRLFGLE
jgi:Fe-S-cluster containining protein